MKEGPSKLESPYGDRAAGKTSLRAIAAGSERSGQSDCMWPVDAEGVRTIDPERQIRVPPTLHDRARPFGMVRDTGGQIC